jgi:peroxiredoxin
MKRILLFLAASAFLASCNKLADNEFQIEGKVDPSLNGKSVYLQKMGGPMGAESVDTAKVENGKFTFKGTVTEPSLHFLDIEGLKTGKVNLVLEHGEIAVEVDKDSVFKSKQGGTYNNDKLYEYFTEAAKQGKLQKKKDAAFRQKYAKEIASAMTTKDTVQMNKLSKLYIAENKEFNDKSVNFIKSNPKAYINVFILRDLLSKRAVSTTEAKAIFDKLDAEVKKTKEGKEIGEMLLIPPMPPKPEAAKPEAEGKPTADLGKPAPAFSAPSPDGKTIALNQALGKVTIVDFWASWCKPCRGENPNVVALYNQFHSKGLNIIGVSLDKDASQWKKAISDDKLTWNHVSNLKFWDEPIAMQYGVKSIPATFILDAKGNIVAKDLRGDALKAKIQELLAAKS